MKLEALAESESVERALAGWRRRAAEILFITVAVVQLPVVIIFLSGHGPPTVPLLKFIGTATYLVVVSVALLRGLDHRTRLWIFFTAGYLLIAIANVVLPDRPYAEVGIVTLPILVLVLADLRPAKFASLISIAILLCAPLLRLQLDIVRWLGVDSAEVGGPQGPIWMRAAALAAFLTGLMVLLDRFHRFLLDSLAAQCRATA